MIATYSTGTAKHQAKSIKAATQKTRTKPTRNAKKKNAFKMICFAAFTEAYIAANKT